MHNTWRKKAGHSTCFLLKSIYNNHSITKWSLIGQHAQHPTYMSINITPLVRHRCQVQQCEPMGRHSAVASHITINISASATPLRWIQMQKVILCHIYVYSDVLLYRLLHLQCHCKFKPLWAIFILYFLPVACGLHSIGSNTPRKSNHNLKFSFWSYE